MEQVESFGTQLKRLQLFCIPLGLLPESLQTSRLRLVSAVYGGLLLLASCWWTHRRLWGEAAAAASYGRPLNCTVAHAFSAAMALASYAASLAFAFTSPYTGASARRLVQKMAAAERALAACTAPARPRPLVAPLVAVTLVAVACLHAADALLWLRGGGDACGSRAGAGPAAHLAESLAAAHALLLARALAAGFRRLNAALRRELLADTACPWLAAFIDDTPCNVKEDSHCHFEYASIANVLVRRNCWAEGAENHRERNQRRACLDGSGVRLLRECHYLLCEAAGEAGRRHRPLALLLLASTAASLARGAAALVMAFAVDDFAKDWSLALLVAWSVWDGGRLLAVVAATDAPLREAEAAPELVHWLRLQLRLREGVAPQLQLSLRELAAFEEQLRPAAAALADCGLFAVDPPLLLAACGAACTAIVILLQFQ